MKSEWDPILTENLKEYANVRLNEGRLEIQFESLQGYTMSMDAKIIPQLIKALQRMEKRV